jgi:hypothetical protein
MRGSLFGAQDTRSPRMRAAAAAADCPRLHGATTGIAFIVCMVRHVLCRWHSAWGAHPAAQVALAVADAGGEQQLLLPTRYCTASREKVPAVVAHT